MNKKIILGTILSVSIGLFGLVKNTNALSLDTSRLGLNYVSGQETNYHWSGDMLYGDTTGGTQGVNYLSLPVGSAARKYFFRTPTVTPTGRFATVHFTTQITTYVQGSLNLGQFPSSNLPLMEIINCSSSTGGFSGNEIIAKDVQATPTYYSGSGVINTKSIIFEGTFTIKNLTANSQGQLQCEIGSNGYTFWTYTQAPQSSPNIRVFFDWNDMVAEYSNSMSDALLQQQVYIQLQQMEQDQNDRSDLSNQSGDNQQQANTAGNQARNTGTTLYAAFTQLVSALTSVNGNSCVLPTMSVYSLTLNNMDLCTFDMPPQIMALVSIGMVFIIVPLGINLVKRMINLYKEIIG